MSSDRPKNPPRCENEFAPADESRRGSETRLRSLIEHAADAYFVHDFEGRFLDVNRRACESLGYLREELLRMTVNDIELDVAKLQKEWGKLEPGEPLTFPGRNRRKDGTVFPVEVRLTCVDADEGRLFLALSRDVTDRQRSENVLWENRAELQEAQRLAQVGSWTLDTGTGAPSYSDEFLRIFGSSKPEDGVVPNLWESASVHPPENRTRLDELIHRTLTLGEPHEIELQLLRPDGTRRTILAHGEPVRDSAGKIVRLRGTVRDITEQRLREEALRLEEQKYRTLFENSVDAVYFTHQDGTILDANLAACRLHGMTVEEMRAVGRGGVVVEDERLLHLVRRRGETGHARGELSLRRKDGSVVPAEVESVVVDPGRRDWTTFVIARDISERVRVDAELRRLAAAVEQTPASIVITDPAGVIQFVNPAFEKITGYSRAEALGARPNVLKSGKHDAAFYWSMWTAITSRRVWKGRIVNRAKDGHLFTEDAVIAPVVDEGGTIRNYVAVKQDITKDLELEEGLAQAQRLESIGRLAGGVAHDFNNLLTVILGATESLRGQLSRGPNGAAEEIEEISAAGRRAAELTRQLLAFARKQPIAPVPLDLNEVVRGAERLLRRSIGEDVELRVNLGEGLWTTRCDQGQLEQVILNLAVNARDAMAGGGTLTLSTRNLPAQEWVGSGAALGGFVELMVQDSGQGMNPEVRAHLFEPFFTTKPLGKGTGLGLATVYGIVRQSGGQVSVESQPGRGTTFHVQLPRWLGAPRQPLPVAAPPSASFGDESILVVEDDPAVRETTVRALRGAGYRVDVASGGAEAMARLEGSQPLPDLILTDLVMPGMNGHELAVRLRGRFANLRVLFVSGYDRDLGPSQGAIEPPQDFLAKPFTPSELLARVRSALGDRKVLRGS